MWPKTKLVPCMCLLFTTKEKLQCISSILMCIWLHSFPYWFCSYLILTRNNHSNVYTRIIYHFSIQFFHINQQQKIEKNQITTLSQLFLVFPIGKYKLNLIIYYYPWNIVLRYVYIYSVIFRTILQLLKINPYISFWK